MMYRFTVNNPDIASNPAGWTASIYKTNRDGSAFNADPNDDHGPSMSMVASGLELDNPLTMTYPNGDPLPLPPEVMQGIASVSYFLPDDGDNSVYIAAFTNEDYSTVSFSEPSYNLVIDASDRETQDYILAAGCVPAGYTQEESLVALDHYRPQHDSKVYYLRVEDDILKDRGGPITYVRKFMGDTLVYFVTFCNYSDMTLVVHRKGKGTSLVTMGVPYSIANEEEPSGAVDLTEVLSKLDGIATAVADSKTASDTQFNGVHSHISSMQSSMGGYFDNVNSRFTNTNQVVQDQASAVMASTGSQISGVMSAIEGVHGHMSDNQDELKTILAGIGGVPSNVIDMIMDIHAEAMGSWSWDKRAGTLTMFDTHGLEAAVFSITDTPDVSSRERRTDLESS